jgi:hypothetical protein
VKISRNTSSGNRSTDEGIRKERASGPRGKNVIAGDCLPLRKSELEYYAMHPKTTLLDGPRAVISPCTIRICADLMKRH